jgi:peptidoglycan hydrolase-like protein with peptidoglycan-binding domain
MRTSMLVTAVIALVTIVPVGNGTAAADLPVANMEAVVKAAQIDPRRPDTALTPGARDSVLLVERALNARGLLASQYIDGHFGTRTIDAYAAYQRSLGYSGLDATGLPGRTSLQLLGEGRYSLVRLLSPGSRTSYHNATMNTRTKDMLVEAEHILARQLVVTQGSYNPGGDPTSAGTHDGGGALDISVSGMTSTTRTNVARVLRQVGFAAWVRTPAQGNWPYHIHAIALSDTDQSIPAQHQAGDYYLGLNGLANRGPDDGPQVTPKLTWEEYKRSIA